MQIKLSFLEDPAKRQPAVWDQLQQEAKSAVVEALARVIAKRIALEKQSGAKHDG